MEEQKQIILFGAGLMYLRMISDFHCAENYSRNHNFRIYNATRGGKLEMFERVEFDSLFYKKD